MAGWSYFSSSTTQLAQSNGAGLNPETLVSRETTSEQGSNIRDGNAVVTSVRSTSKLKTVSTVVVEAPLEPKPTARKQLSISEAFSFKWTFHGRQQPGKGRLSVVHPHAHREKSRDSLIAKPQKKRRVSRADKRAKKTALRVQAMITGDATVATPQVSPVVAKARLNKIKSQLSEPKTANKLIAELRSLPVPVGDGATATPGAAVHGVCLEHTDAEEEALHFARLQTMQPNGLRSMSAVSLSAAPADRLAEVLNDMHIVDLLQAPDLGLGQPGDGKGLLAGALPTPETVLHGIKEITPQLMALGYATGRMVAPDHSGIYPPTDRISVLTYWWGLEIVLPPPTIVYLSTAHSIAGSIVNFLSAMALVNNGVREILPLVRYIAQYIDVEYNSIKAQDKGKGVVCAATWLMPAALVPRPWDFLEPPATSAVASEQTGTEANDGKPSPPADANQNGSPKPPKPRPISSILDTVTPPPQSINPISV